MDDRLDDVLRATEGAGPSADFVTRLRNEVLTEASARPESRLSIGDVPHSDSSPRAETRSTTSPTQRPILLIGSVAAMVLVVALAVVRLGGSQIVTTDRTEETGPTVAPSTEETPAAIVDDPTSTTLPADDASDGGPVRFDPTAELADRDPAFIEEGSHRIDTLGTAFTFELDEAVFVEPNSSGATALSDPSASGETGDRDIHLMRLSALSDPTRPTQPLDDPDDGWPADDPGGWLDRLPDSIVVSDRATTTLGGLAALSAELRIDDTICESGGDDCVVFGTNHLVTTKSLWAGGRFRVWFIDQGTDDPLAVLVGIRDESDSDWFDVADDVLATLAFGDVAPNPVTAVTAGRAELRFLGGISVDFTEADAVVEARHRGVIALLGDDGGSELLSTLLTSDGETLESTDDLVATLTPLVRSLSELEPTVVDGLPARVFDVRGAGTTRPTLLRGPDDQRGWFAPPGGRLWLIEHPDRGLLMITAESGRTEGPEFDAVLERTEGLVASIEFVG